MLHNQRLWSLTSVTSAEELAHKLSHYTWTCCTAFMLGGYIFANDATSPDGAQEYAVLKASSTGDVLDQIESITFSWCSESQSLAYVQRVLAGEFDDCPLANVERCRFQTATEHGSCGWCC